MVMVKVRHAKVADVPHMLRIINGYAEKGLMLPRSLNQIYDHLRDFVVAEEDGRVKGCGALYVVWEDLGEIRSIAVEASERGKGIGSKIVRYLLDEAKEIELRKVFVLTYQKEFFARFGFKVVPKDTLPHKVWKDCLDCVKFPNCDEIAMAMELDGGGS